MVDDNTSAATVGVETNIFTLFYSICKYQSQRRKVNKMNFPADGGDGSCRTEKARNSPVRQKVCN